MTADTPEDIESSTDSSTDDERRFETPEFTDAAIRGLGAGVRVDGRIGTAEITRPSATETLVDVLHRTSAPLSDETDETRKASVSLRAAAGDAGTAEATVFFDETDADAARELADALDHVATFLEHADE